MGAVDFSSFLEEFEHNGRAAESNQQSEEDGFTHAVAGLLGDEISSQKGQDHLERATQQDGFLDLQQGLEGELNSNCKEEEHNSDFSQNINFMSRFHQPQSVRSCQYTGQEKAHDGGYSNVVADEDDANGEPEYDDDVIEKRYGHSLDKQVFRPFQSKSFLLFTIPNSGQSSS